MSLAHAFLHGLVEILGEERCAAIEESSQRSNEGTYETDGYDTLNTSRKNVLYHHGESTISRLMVGNIHDDTATALQ